MFVILDSTYISRGSRANIDCLVHFGVRTSQIVHVDIEAGVISFCRVIGIRVNIV